MNITVIGAGPAGLYFAADAARHIPNCRLTLYEKGPADADNGLGYVCDQQITGFLGAIDKHARAQLHIATRPTWSESQIEKPPVQVRASFPESYGMPRRDMITFLTEHALAAGVQIEYDTPIAAHDVESLRTDSDILVGADGIHSVVRKVYAHQFRASTIDGSNSFLWLSSESNHGCIKMVCSEYESSALMATSYPVARNEETVVVECATSTAEKHAFADSDGYLNANGWQALSDVFGTEHSHYKFSRGRAKWYPTQLNISSKLNYENVILIGEAGISFYYGSGVGNNNAFTASKVSMHCLQQEKNPTEAAQLYSDTVCDKLLQALSRSQTCMRWREKMDRYYFADILPTDFIRALAANQPIVA